MRLTILFSIAAAVSALPNPDAVVEARLPDSNTTAQLSAPLTPMHAAKHTLKRLVTIDDNKQTGRRSMREIVRALPEV